MTQEQAPEAEVAVDEDRTIHAHLELPTGDEAEAGEETEEEPAPADELPSVGDVVGTVIKAAGKAAAKTAEVLWDVVKPEGSSEP